MQPSTEIWTWDAADLARAIRLRQVSAREATEAALRRCAAVNPAINAVVELLEAEALAAADAADAAVKAGEALGPLHGVPVTTKVNVDQRGCATTIGVVALRDAVAAEDSAVVANLRRAGAVIIGRTNAPAFAFRWFTDNALYGRTSNPWSAAHTPGGSSGGAAAAVAAGIGAVAHGNDLGGSIRYPAFVTGLVGLRPSAGRVPGFNPASRTERPISAQLMSTQGPLARRAADARLALAAMSEGDPRDPWWMPVALEGPPVPRPIRVALSADPLGAGVHPEVAEAVRRAGVVLAEAGYAVEEVEPPDFAGAVEDMDALAHGESLLFTSAAVERDADPQARDVFRFRAARTPRLDTEGFLRTLARRATRQRAWALFFAHHPLLVCPVSAEPPFPQGLDAEGQAQYDRVFAAQKVLFAAPLLGLPAVSVPTGLSSGGLPLGVQIIGPRWREDLVLDAAEAVEARCPMPTPIDPR